MIHPRFIAEFLLPEVDYFELYVNPKVSGVVLPRPLYAQDFVLLHIGHGLARPILGFSLDDYGLSGTLSFPSGPCETLIPWHAVFTIAALDGFTAQWPKPCEMGPLPELFPGREKSGADFWCPRKQRVVASSHCKSYGCKNTACFYGVREAPEAVPGVVGAAMSSKLGFHAGRKFEVIEGGKRDDEDGAA